MLRVYFKGVAGQGPLAAVQHVAQDGWELDEVRIGSRAQLASLEWCQDAQDKAPDQIQVRFLLQSKAGRDLGHAVSHAGCLVRCTELWNQNSGACE